MPFRPTHFFALLTLSATLLPAQTAAPIPQNLAIPNASVPWAMDHFAGKPELVPIHNSKVEVNSHTGANILGALGGSIFYKPKMTLELPGVHARTTLHDTIPTIYYLLQKEPDGSPSSEVWTLVRATPDKDRRVFVRLQFAQVGGGSNHTDSVVETTTEELSNGWKRITPKAPLEPGEYAVTPILKGQNNYATEVYDFTVDPAAPNAPDAVLPSPAR